MQLNGGKKLFCFKTVLTGCVGALMSLAPDFVRPSMDRGVQRESGWVVKFVIEVQEKVESFVPLLQDGADAPGLPGSRFTYKRLNSREIHPD